jgi:prepilin peptidase CpaA
MEVIPLSILAIVLIVSVITDIRSQKILNTVTLPGMLAALTYHSTVSGWSGLFHSIEGLGLGMLFFILPYLAGGMGAGDVKLMGAVGALLGPENIFYAFLYTALFGGTYAVILIVANRKQFLGFGREIFDKLLNMALTKKFTSEPVQKNHQRPRLCYGVAIALGTGLHTILSLTGNSPLN